MFGSLMSSDNRQNKLRGGRKVRMGGGGDKE